MAVQREKAMNRNMVKGIDPGTSGKIANLGLVCALLVVVIHVCQPKEVGSPAWWLYSLTHIRNMAVPFFFVVAGYLLAGHSDEPGWWKRENLKRLRTLVVPYAIWSLVWLLYWWTCVMRLNVADGRPMFSRTKLVLNATFLGLDFFVHPNLPPLWFVRALLVLVLVSPALLWALRKWCIPVLAVAFLNKFFYWGDGLYGTWAYFVEQGLGLGYAFFFMGGMAIRLDLVSVPRFRFDAAVSGLACAVMWGVQTGIAAGMIPLAANGMVCRALDLPSVLLMMYFAWCVVPSTRWPAVLTSSAFPVYLVHVFALDVFGQAFFRVPETVMQLFARSLFGIGCSIVIVLCLRKFCPRASGLLFGGR